MTASSHYISINNCQFIKKTLKAFHKSAKIWNFETLINLISKVSGRLPNTHICDLVSDIIILYLLFSFGLIYETLDWSGVGFNLYEKQYQFRLLRYFKSYRKVNNTIKVKCNPDFLNSWISYHNQIKVYFNKLHKSNRQKTREEKRKRVGRFTLARKDFRRGEIVGIVGRSRVATA